MTLYELDGVKYAVVRGELYRHVQPVAEGKVVGASEEPDQEPVVKRRRRRRTNGGWTGVAREIRRTKARKSRVILGPEAEAAVIQDIRAGLGLTDACKKYGISVATYYKLKNESKSKPVVEETIN